MKCFHCNEEGLSLLDLGTFSRKEKIITCRVCSKQSYFPNLKINEESPTVYMFIVILLVTGYISSYPLNIILYGILLIVSFSMLFNRKVYPFNTEEELNILKECFSSTKENNDTRLNDYPEALEYHKNNDAFRLAIFYEETLKDYKEAILWYEKAYIKGNNDSLNIIGLIYKNYLNDNHKAKEYFIKSMKTGNTDSMQNLAIFYHEIVKDNITASAYYISLIDIRYSKELVLKLLHEEWKLSNETIKKGYELQLKMEGLPRRYTGDLNLN